jgi:hypothetical protein
VRVLFSPRLLSRVKKAIPAFAVFDACMTDVEWTRGKSIQELFMHHRKLRTTIVLTMQYPEKLPGLMHGQIEYVFLLREDAASNRRLAHKLYGGALGLDEFHDVMNQVTQSNKGDCVVVNNIPESSRREDQLYWYRAATRAPGVSQEDAV